MQRTVMIVDDSIPLHRLIKAQLDADDLTFHSVYDGNTAVTTAASLRPDLILLDIDMPTMDGFEACAIIKANPATANIPLMFLSAESAPEDKTKAMALGAFDYIQKPFRPDQLKSAVHSKLRSIASADGALLIDRATGLWNKEFLEVQVREQYVLSALCSQPISCAMLEIDQLHSLSIRFGTKTANCIMHVAARILSDQCGADATICSLPNRRFAIILRNHDRSTAKPICKVIQQQINAIEIAVDPRHRLTCSFGVCDNQIASAMTLIDRTASVLERAIDRGGNCIAVARGGAMTVARMSLN